MGDAYRNAKTHAVTAPAGTRVTPPAAPSWRWPRFDVTERLVAARVIAVEDVVAHDIPDRTLDVRIRHHGQPFRGRLVLTGDGSGEVVLEDAAEAVAPGQTAALYDGDRLVAAGRIAGAPAPGNRTED